MISAHLMNAVQYTIKYIYYESSSLNEYGSLYLNRPSEARPLLQCVNGGRAREGVGAKMIIGF